MYRYCIMTAWLLAAVPLSAVERPVADEAPATPWYKRLFSSPPKPAPKPEPVVAEKPPTWTDVSRSLDQERAVYMERLQFCTRLRQIAAESGDEELFGKSDELEEQAESVFTKRTSKLPNIVQDVKAAEATLEQRRPEPPSGTAAATTVTGRSPNGRPIRE